MFHALVLSLSLAAAAPSGSDSGGPAPRSTERAAYEKARTEVGRDPDAQVKLALWCEAHGLAAERLEHLALAALLDPANATARGLMGLVADRGQWRRPEAVGARVKADEALVANLARYNGRRAGMADTADAHWKLAVWCEQNGLKPEARAHFTAVTRLEPGRSDAWKRLGFKRHRGEWLTAAQIAARGTEAEAQRQADRRYGPALAEARSWRRQGTARSAAAEERLEGVADPRAVPSIWKVFAQGGDDDQAIATRLFGQVDGPAAGKALVQLAVFGRSDDVRESATETLANRDPSEFVDVLLHLLQPSLHYEVRPPEGPGSVGVLFVASEAVELQRNYLASDVPIAPPRSGAKALAAQVGMIEGSGNAERDRKAATAAIRQQLQQDKAQVEAFNQAAKQWNSRVLAVLSAVAGSDLGSDPATWKAWWADHEGYALPTVQYRRTRLQQNVQMSVLRRYRPSHRCFAAGTLVRTLDGTRPIESLRIGDQVLTQDSNSGTLHFEPVVAVFHNPPNETLRITFEGQDESILSTGIHRFWKAGKGWVLARDLEPGDTVRTLGGTAVVRQVEPDEVQLVYNLEVASGHSFFVGTVGALVHDNSPAQPVLAPFDAVAGLAAPAAAKR